MSPRRRTLGFVLIFLSLNNDLVFVAGLPVGPVLTEYYPSPGSPPQLVNSVLTVTSGPGNRVLLEPPPKFPTQQFNELFSIGFYPPGLSIDTVATTNYGVTKPNYLNTCSTYSPLVTLNPLPIVETIVENFPAVTQTIQFEDYAPTANVAEIYQTPNTVQIPSMPQLSPFIGVVSPLPEILPSQTYIQEVYTPNFVPKIYPQIVETITSVPVETVETITSVPVQTIETITSVPVQTVETITSVPVQTIETITSVPVQTIETITSVPVQTIETITSVPVETTTLNIPPSDIGQQLPVALQINLASPWASEPVRAVISQPAPAPRPSPSFDPSFSMPPAPIIVMEKSKSKLKSILPILLLTLIDGGCGNSGGGGGGGGCGGSCGCSQCSVTPVPFPILIPTNNPVINRGRSKASTDPKC